MDAHNEAMRGGAAEIRGLIGAVRRRWFASVAFRAIGLGAAAAALPTLAAGLVYWMVAPRGTALLLLASAAAFVTAVLIVLVVRRIERRPDDRRVARFIQERAEAQPGAASMNECLVSAVEAMHVPPTGDGAPFAALVLATAVRCVDGITPATIITPERLRRSALVGGGGLALLVAALVLTAPALSHVVQTARLRVFPQTVNVEVLPGDVRIPAGQPLKIRARVLAGESELSRSQPRLMVTAGGDQRTVDMVPAGDAFEFAFDSVDRSFAYKVTAGPVASGDYQVTALFPPRVKRIDIDYQYPSFSGMAPRTEEDGGDIYAPQGTRVRLRIEADKPIASGELSLSRARNSLSPSSPTAVFADLVLTKDDSYRVRLTDTDGLRSDADSEYFIRLMDDRPPEVRILRPSADQGITPLEEVAIEARAEDDYGVASLDLVYSVAGGKEQVVPFRRLAGTDTQRNGQYVLAAEDLRVKPGDVITYYARARDVGRGKRPSETKTDIFFLEVQPFNAEFENAVSQAGGGGASGDPQIEGLIQAQKEIISATWNVERRSGAGRSDDDIKAIAQAQSDLKARAERMMSASRGRRGRGFAPQAIAPQVPRPPQAGATDPVATAVEAMNKAIEQLSSAKTRDAIPHEMAALNGLLKAQAEVKRRQIMQQQSNASGGGFGNRQTQDLSALFDKELQRQQRTNYEQRSQIEERQQQPQNDQASMDRIRDLARRQEELSRQQRELAQMTAEERKRQLERLTREQQELQRQLEELSRQTRQQGNQQQSAQQQGQQQSGQQHSGQQQSGQQQSGQQQSGQPQPGQQSRGTQQGAGEVRDALEQMRQAANDLRRDDAEGAARRGERAAEQLRRAEQQMRGGSADAQQRAAADLQAEAQQIAQEQQRIAAEAGRLEKGGEANGADARRRLAADKDRLADRVDALQRETQRLGREGGKGSEQARARDAAGELERQRIGERMREAAGQMRSGSAQPSAAAEQQVARSLEQVVEKLGGPSSSDARQMAEQLERSREIRDRLDRLESQVREAEGRKDGEADRLRQQYEQELRRTRQELGRQPGQAPGGEQRDGTGRATPEQHEFSRSATGTEGFKQDRSNWESLRKDVNRALEEHDAAVSRRLANALGDHRLSAGGSDRVPEQYRRLVARYYESLAKSRK